MYHCEGHRTSAMWLMQITPGLYISFAYTRCYGSPAHLDIHLLLWWLSSFAYMYLMLWNRTMVHVCTVLVHSVISIKMAMIPNELHKAWMGNTGRYQKHNSYYQDRNISARPGIHVSWSVYGRWQHQQQHVAQRNQLLDGPNDKLQHALH